MKKIATILAAVLLTASVFAQTPEKMSYQAVVRDASDNLVTNTAIGMQISILQGSASGTVVYIETQTPTTNANGLVTIEIGTGTTADDFSAIDWTNGTYFIKTETDPTGGTNYTITGTSQLLSVPYALHAKTAENVTGTITETDPVFGTSVAGGITETDTANWNNKLDSYTETDPEFTAWDKSTGISITESQISDLSHFTNANETDPVFGTSVANGITETDTANWNNKLDIEVDGDTLNELELPTDASHGDIAYYNGNNWQSIDKPTDSMYVHVLTWDFNSDKPIWKKGDINLPTIMVNGVEINVFPVDNSPAKFWREGNSTETNAISTTDGRANTDSIVAAHGAGDYAAYLCDTLSAYGYSDWYLPASEELNGIYENRVYLGIDNPQGTTYWSSTETSKYYAIYQDFYGGSQVATNKSNDHTVRCVRVK
ncbi:MAG: DUF1566 domain-containing protein [Chlorobi bacterium]|nr:DUF1566 domain-containing protein [Chlorobiota bacterium]